MVALMLVGTLVGLCIHPLLIPFMGRIGVVDVPNHRSSHRSATPLGGGLGVMIAVLIALLVPAYADQGRAIDAALCCLGLGMLGLIDDVWQLSPTLRLCSAFAFGAASVAFLGAGSMPAAGAAFALGTWMAVCVNAFNFMDGINGVSVFTGAVAGLAYIWLGSTYNIVSVSALGAALTGSCLAFAPFNVPTARAFLGDAGAYYIGATIASAAWLAWAAGAPALLAAAPMAIYLSDTGATLARRILRRAPLKEGHREHAYQRLVDGGLPHTVVSLQVAGFGSLCVATLVVAHQTEHTRIGVAITMVLLATYLAMPSVMSSRRRLG